MKPLRIGDFQAPTVNLPEGNWPVDSRNSSWPYGGKWPFKEHIPLKHADFQ